MQGAKLKAKRESRVQIEIYRLRGQDKKIYISFREYLFFLDVYNLSIGRGACF